MKREQGISKAERKSMRKTAVATPASGKLVDKKYGKTAWRKKKLRLEYKKQGKSYKSGLTKPDMEGVRVV